ncbi:nuclear transport factor 2 family protein [Sphingomonas turrisvirgatae]|uniref:SnoaL-like domain-containing protein n=1 Tax=Sphingomonas turrisvirgatae TaxID=1888892 RepID=A0A1E3LXB0_9SPHN|nr:nuclear transport factor 2 family protein [Sphingomonas turrisvirgatae]ODP38427.1 hypothetical protein BFL28_13675 [Sphingomonas turrisvirgatae]
MSDAAQQVTTLAAIEAIKALKARYFRFVDTKDWDALRTLFLPGATLHFAHRTDDPETAEVAISRISQILFPGVVSVHSGGIPEIEVEGDRATAVWPMSDLLVFPIDRLNPFGLARLHGYGYYRERYERRDGAWRIAALRLDRLHVETVPLPGAVPAE